LVAGNAAADSAWGTHDWDPDPGSGAWTSYYGWAQVGEPTSGGNTGGWLSVTFTNTAVGPDSSWQDIIAVDATSLFAGTYSISNWFAFDFFASNVLPNALQVRWSSSTNSRIWGAPISGPTSTGVWESLRSPSLSNWDDWDIEPFGDANIFASDLSTIGWVGLYIDRNTAVEQLYGVDNFALMIPEPAEIIMLAFALIAIWVAYRKREAVAEVISNQ
jgi:hypothetical protein